MSGGGIGVDNPVVGYSGGQPVYQYKDQEQFRDSFDGTSALIGHFLKLNNTPSNVMAGQMPAWQPRPQTTFAPSHVQDYSAMVNQGLLDIGGVKK